MFLLFLGLYLYVNMCFERSINREWCRTVSLIVQVDYLQYDYRTRSKKGSRVGK